MREGGFNYMYVFNVFFFWHGSKALYEGNALLFRRTQRGAPVSQVVKINASVAETRAALVHRLAKNGVHKQLRH